MIVNPTPLVAERDLDQLTDLFKLLSDKTRLNLLLSLAGGERNVTSLCELLALPQPTVSHHLALLKVNNIVGSRRQGKQVFYSLNGRVDRVSESELRIHVEQFAVMICHKPDPR